MRLYTDKGKAALAKKIEKLHAKKDVKLSSIKKDGKD